MVRAHQYHGDPAELRHSGNVPALREHRLHLRALSGSTGQYEHIQSSTQTSSFSKPCGQPTKAAL